MLTSLSAGVSTSLSAGVFTTPSAQLIFCKPLITVVSLFFSRLLGTGDWMSLKDLQDPKLQNLAADFPATILKSRAPSTTRKYMGAFRRWKAWITKHQLPVFPHGHGIKILPLELQATICKSKMSTTHTFYSAVREYHISWNLQLESS